jgi:hypothetical protein
MILKKSKKNLKIKSKTKSKKNLKTKSKKNLRGGVLTFGKLPPLRTRYAGISKKIEATHATHAAHAAQKQSVQSFQPNKPLDFPEAAKAVQTPFIKINYPKI